MKTDTLAAPDSVTFTVTDLEISPAIESKHDDQPFIKEKVRRANEILARTGPPNFSELKKQL